MTEAAGRRRRSRPTTLEQLLLQMWQIRCFETRAGELFDEGLIHGPVHSYAGMEAIAVGVCSSLGPDDLITSTHRGHGHCIAKGLDLARMMAEILGREDGYCRGHGGSMHITAIDKGMLGADAIVAGSLGDRGRRRARPAAPGQGRRHRLLLRRRRGEPGHPPRGVQPRRRARRARSSSCARTTSGRSRRRSRAVTRVDDIAVRAAGYGFPGVVVDGNDVLAVRDAGRRGGRPGPLGRRPDADRGEELPHRRPIRPRRQDGSPCARRSSRSGARAIRSSASRATSSTEAGSRRRASRSSRPRRAQSVAEAVEVGARVAPPEPGAELEDVYAPAAWLTPGRLS